MKDHRGSYTVTNTPFTEGGAAINEPVLRQFIDWQIDEGSHGLIALGSIGQFLSVSDEERGRIVEVYVQQAKGRVPVFVGTMSARTATAVRYSKQAEALGADGVMITPPFYYSPTDDEIFDYYKAISEAISIPIMLYNNPLTTHVDMSAALVARLTKAFENVRYIKEASGDSMRLYDIYRLTGGVMNNFAANRVYESYPLAVKGYVSPPGNWAPGQSALMLDALASGDMKTAKTISDLFTDIGRLSAKGHPTYGHACMGRELIKYTSGLDLGDPRPPLGSFRSLGKEGEEKLAQIKPLVDKVRAIPFKKAARAAE